MPRIDVWDVVEPQVQQLSCGFPACFDSKYRFTGKQLGQGGFGLVRVVTSVSSGREFACKSIKKRLEVPNASPDKQQQHLDNIKREAAILRKLRGTLNVVHLEDVLEDEVYVHIVMELCTGGELLHAIGKRHYSERTVASFMRAVLRTLAQCHHKKILHRDIKPGNFMLLSDAPDAPLKAIDFGLACFFDPKQLPRTDLGLEGTPWFMAPEVLSSQVYPASDVWAAGVMAYQLLSGSFPFDDRKNQRSPALSLVWRSILTEEPAFTKPVWNEISDDAKDFVNSLLIKDPLSRPSARAALSHRWLQGNVKQRSEGRPLSAQVVQRLQRFSVENALKRTILDMIANELLQRHMSAMQEEEQRQSRDHQEQQAVPEPAAGSSHAGSPAGLPQTIGRLRGAAATDLLKRLATKSHTVHAGGEILGLLNKQPVSGQRYSLDKPFLSDSAPTDKQLTPASPPATQQLPTGSASALQSPCTVQTMVGTFTGSLPAASQQLPADPLPQAVSAKSQPMHTECELPVAPRLSQPGTPAEASLSMHRQRSSGLLGSMENLARPGAGPEYKGPVRNPAAASARDLQFMAHKLATEGSGHALQHYAWLLSMGERSRHGLPAQSLATPPSPSGSDMSQRQGTKRDSQTRGPSADYLRMLDIIQQQRAEHRKMQRLSLDTSGHRQADYAQYLASRMAHDQDSRLSKDSIREQDEDMTDSPRAGSAPTSIVPGSTSSSAHPVTITAPNPSIDASSSSLASTGVQQVMPAEGSEKSLLRKVGETLMKPIQALLPNKVGGSRSGKNTPQDRSKSGRHTTDSLPRSLSGSRHSRRSEELAEGGGRRGQGGYLALMQGSKPDSRSDSFSKAAAGAPQHAGSTPPPEVASMPHLPAPSAALNIVTVKAHHAPHHPVNVSRTSPAQQPGQAAASDAARDNLPTQQPSAQSLPAAAVPGPLANRYQPSASDVATTPASLADMVEAATGLGTAGVAQGTVVQGLATLIGDPGQVHDFQEILRRLGYGDKQVLTYEQVSEGLQWLGYHLEPSEVRDLLQEVALGGDSVTRSQFIASLVDWRSFAANHKEEWLECLRNTFNTLDADNDQRINTSDLIKVLQDKLPEDQVNEAVQEILMDAAVTDEQGLDFDDFVKLVRVNSGDSLASDASHDLYDARWRLEQSVHGHGLPGSVPGKSVLEPVPDED